MLSDSGGVLPVLELDMSLILYWYLLKFLFYISDFAHVVRSAILVAWFLSYPLFAVFCPILNILDIFFD